jgi:hypothetical protein
VESISAFNGTRMEIVREIYMLVILHASLGMVFICCGHRIVYEAMRVKNMTVHGVRKYLPLYFAEYLPYS